jgi:hypothetical protein
MSVPSAETQSETSRGDSVGTAFWAVTAAFGAYFCMYAFRRPYAAATFEGEYGGIGFKTLLVTSQVVGYAIAKFIGIRVVAETPWNHRVRRFMALIALALASLLLFAVLPRPWSAIGLFCNGLSLGMVFGMVLGFLEGRRVTEALSAGLCASFILADGVTKSVGAWLLAQGVSEAWMPFTAGLLFLAPVCVFAGMLARIPPPSAADQRARSKRVAMTADDRRSFVRRYGVGLGALVVMYLLITVLRSFRADFQPELFRELGQAVTPTVFARTELLVMLGVLAINGSAALIRDNRIAFNVALLTCGAGLLLIVVALAGWRMEYLSGFVFMILIGQGVYLPYVAVHTTVFERLLAMRRERANLGFLMCIADAIGYLGYAVVMLVRSAAVVDEGALPLFDWMCRVCVVLSAIALLVVWWFFAASPVAERRTLAEELA